MTFYEQHGKKLHDALIEIERLRAALKGAEIALARDGNIDGAMRCILGADQQNEDAK